MPCIIFRYSYPYDLHWDEWRKKQLNSKESQALKRTCILKLIKEIDEKWKFIENEAFNEISKITNLEWQEKDILCYIVSNCRALSDPLTVGINNRHSEKVTETILHELTHKIFSQELNQEKTKKSWEWVRNVYPHENRITHTHIICFSVLKHLYLYLFDEERLKKEIKRCGKKEDYRRAWEIVEKDNYLEILKEFKYCYNSKRVEN